MEDEDLDLIYVHSCENIELYPLCNSCGSKCDETGKCCNPNCTNDRGNHFQWKIYLKLLPKHNPNMDSAVSVFVSGHILDLIMGITVDDFIYLAKKYQDIYELLALYFYHSYFLMELGYDRILRILLPLGNSLSFIRWLGMQNSYDYHELISDILMQYKSTEFDPTIEPSNIAFYVSC